MAVVQCFWCGSPIAGSVSTHRWRFAACGKHSNDLRELVLEMRELAPEGVTPLSLAGTPWWAQHKQLVLDQEPDSFTRWYTLTGWRLS